MGVRGLMTYVKENPHLLQDYHLRDTTLIIDGSNMCHSFYANSEIPFCYGGDYADFADKLRVFFKTLQSCLVNPYVVFDGFYENTDRRLELSESRAKYRLKNIMENESVLPILAQHTLCKVLDECGIQHATCHMDADREIAALANAWDSPVLSNDSDFFIYPLNGGVVLFDTLKRKPEIKISKRGSIRKYLPAKRYKMVYLWQKYGEIDLKRMALFATLRGNDQVDRSKFYPIYNNADIFRTAKFVDRSDQALFQIDRLLTYLSIQESLNDAIDHLMRFIPRDEREDISKEIHSSIKKYTDTSNGSLCSLTGGTLGAGPVVTPVCDACTWQGIPIPDSLLTALRSANISPQPLNAVINRVVFLPSQYEDVSEASSHCCAQDIRAATYGIILRSRPEVLASHSKSKLWEYDRIGDDILEKNLEITLLMPDKSLVPSLQEVAAMGEEGRRKIFNEGLGMRRECHPDCDLHFLLSTIAAWIRRAQPKPVHVYALWLCVLKINVITPMTTSENAVGTADSSSPSASTSATLEKNPNDVCKHLSRNTTATGKDIGRFECLEILKGRCSIEECEFAERSLKAFENPRSLAVDMTHVHAFAQFQAIYRAALDFNAVLNGPYRPTCASLIFQGSFLHNVSVDLMKRSQPLAVVAYMLGQKNVLASWFERSVADITKLGGKSSL